MTYFGYNIPIFFNMPMVVQFERPSDSTNQDSGKNATISGLATALDTFIKEQKEEQHTRPQNRPPVTLPGFNLPQMIFPPIVFPPNFFPQQPIVTKPPEEEKPTKPAENTTPSSRLQSWDDINNLSNKTSWLDVNRAEVKKGREARRRIWNKNKNVSKPELNTHRNDATVKTLNNYLSTLNLQYDDVKAHELANNIYQGSMGNKSYGYCFAFVKMGLEETFDDIGYLPGASAIEAPGVFQNDKQVRRHFTKLPERIVKELDFNKLPAGCIVIYKPGNTLHKSEYGHIEVALGNGNTCSDYIKSKNSGQIPRNAEQWKNVEIYVPTMPA